MSSNPVKSNGLLIAILVYLMIFGVKINIGGSTSLARNPDCIPIEASIIDPAPTLPIIPKEHLSNKTYVIKVLINHINALNAYIETSNKSSNNVLNKYNECVGD